jgi:4-hydroxybenzoate polyprenyltransferase
MKTNSLLLQVRDHLLICGHSGITGWVLLALLVASGGVSGGQLNPGVDPLVFSLTLAAAALVGNGVYALNAYYDREIDKINKPGRPIPSNRMMSKHAFRYAVSLLALGWLVSLVVSFLTSNHLTVALWSVFTILGITYSMPPLKLKARHIFGNLCFSAFAALALTISSVAFGKVGPTSLEVVMMFCIFTGLVTLKDFRDFEGDKVGGDMTLPVKLGRRKAAAVSMILVCVPLTVKFVIDVVNRSILWWMVRGGTWLFLLYVCSFGIYILLDYRMGSAVSKVYSVEQYYLLVFLTAYFLIRVPILGFELRAYDSEILLSYFLFAAITLLSFLRGRQTLQQTS